MSEDTIKVIKPAIQAATGCNKPDKPAQPCTPVLTSRLEEEAVEQLAAIFKAIAHPVRIKILDLIDQGDGEACSCEIERFFDLSQPTISHHLKILQEAGLVTSESRGVWVYHKIRPQAFDILREHLEHFISSK
jgi:ArsR family transcriptional regulator, arsenate/arsenite/antimonite-responsive transcriptional repressor